MKTIYLIIISLSIILIGGCSSNSEEEAFKATIVRDSLGYPNVTEHNGSFYLTGQKDDIFICKASSIDSLATATPHVVWEHSTNRMHNIWAPEMVRINDKWYIYFEADDGNTTDNHQLYVIENPADDPTTGKWTLHGPIKTDEEWNFGIHPSTFVLNGRQYLLWSGWEHRRAETETQCIFIAEMENPWTLKSERVLISRPELEWERQWINPDGSRSAYPIFVNENPEPLVSPDGKHLAVAYSASGIWTLYATIGLLMADTDKDLLDADSWKKADEPLHNAFTDETPVESISNISALQCSDGKSYLFYQLRDSGGGSAVYVKEFHWNADGTPDFGFE